VGSGRSGRRNDPRRGGLFVLASAGLLALLGWSFTPATPVSLSDAFVLDAFALFAKRILLAAALLTIVGLYPYARRRGIADRSAEAIVLLLFATVGGMALVSAREFLTLFVAFELLSLPLYVLAALEKERRPCRRRGDQAVPVRKRQLGHPVARDRIPLRGGWYDVLDARDLVARRSDGRARSGPRAGRVRIQDRHLPVLALGPGHVSGSADARRRLSVGSTQGGGGRGPSSA
jgi:hypothetical protein